MDTLRAVPEMLDSDKRVTKTGSSVDDPREWTEDEAICEVELLAIDSHPKLQRSTVSVESMTEDSITISGVPREDYSDD